MISAFVLITVGSCGKLVPPDEAAQKAIPGDELNGLLKEIILINHQRFRTQTRRNLLFIQGS